MKDAHSREHLPGRGDICASATRGGTLRRLQVIQVRLVLGAGRGAEEGYDIGSNLDFILRSH